MEKAVFNRQKTSKLDLNLRKKLVKCYIWSIALYGAETWTLHAFHEPRIWFHSTLAEKYHIIFVDLFERRFQPEKKLKTTGSKLSSGLVVSL